MLLRHRKLQRTGRHKDRWSPAVTPDRSRSSRASADTSAAPSLLQQQTRWVMTFSCDFCSFAAKNMTFENLQNTILEIKKCKKGDGWVFFKEHTSTTSVWHHTWSVVHTSTSATRSTSRRGVDVDEQHCGGETERNRRKRRSRAERECIYKRKAQEGMAA